MFTFVFNHTDMPKDILLPECKETYLALVAAYVPYKPVVRVGKHKYRLLGLVEDTLYVSHIPNLDKIMRMNYRRTRLERDPLIEAKMMLRLTILTE